MATTIVFDLGGVLLHWQPAALLMTHLPERLKSLDEAAVLAAEFFQSFQPGGTWAEFDRGILAPEQVAQQIASRTSLPLAAVNAVMAGIPAHLQLRDDTADLVRRLKAAGHRLVFLSNMPAPYIAHVQHQLDSLQAFEQGIYSSNVRMVKPEDAVFALALREFGCRAGDCVFLDDSAVNVAAAQRAGWRALRFVDPHHAHRELAALGLLSAQ